MDCVGVFTLIGTAIATIAFVYAFLRNFKNDINSHIDKLEARLEARMNSLEERMFYMATGKKLEDAIKEERMKNPKTDP